MHAKKPVLYLLSKLSVNFNVCTVLWRWRFVFIHLPSYMFLQEKTSQSASRNMGGQWQWIYSHKTLHIRRTENNNHVTYVQIMHVQSNKVTNQPGELTLSIITSMNLQILNNNFLFLRLNNASNWTVFGFWQKYLVSDCTWLDSEVGITHPFDQRTSI